MNAHVCCPQRKGHQIPLEPESQTVVKQVWLCPLVNPALKRRKQSDPWNSLASQPTPWFQINSKRCLKKRKEHGSNGITFRGFPWPLHTCSCSYTYVHTHKDIYLQDKNQNSYEICNSEPALARMVRENENEEKAEKRRQARCRSVNDQARKWNVTQQSKGMNSQFE